MGCATKNAKVVAISLGSLQRLIALKAVPQSAVPLIINTMVDAVSQGVDIQLRILQTLLSLVTNFPEVHGDLLGDVRNRLYCHLKNCLLFNAELIYRPCYYVSNCKNRVLQWCRPQQQPRSGNSSCS
jgi:Dimerisation and cyclophilin-binding domain of Mon2